MKPAGFLKRLSLKYYSNAKHNAGLCDFPKHSMGQNHFFHGAFVNPAYSVHKVKSSDCPLIKPEFLEEMRANMT